MLLSANPLIVLQPQHLQFWCLTGAKLWPQHRSHFVSVTLFSLDCICSVNIGQEPMGGHKPSSDTAWPCCLCLPLRGSHRHQRMKCPSWAAAKVNFCWINTLLTYMFSQDLVICDGAYNCCPNFLQTLYATKSFWAHFKKKVLFFLIDCLLHTASCTQILNGDI